MTFIPTAGGDELDVRYPSSSHITPLTIAWHLSQINRFTGAAIRPYSVAEHSLLVAEIAERELHLDVHGLLYAHMHDAHEAFTGDLASPNKPVIGQPWHEFEGRWERVVASTFGLYTARGVHATAVRKADLMALASERVALLHPTPTPWPVLVAEGINPVGWAVVDLQDPARTTHNWEFWRDRWLDRYHELEEARNALHFPIQSQE
jgi:uncharacterized protein